MGRARAQGISTTQQVCWYVVSVWRLTTGRERAKGFSGQVGFQGQGALQMFVLKGVEQRICYAKALRIPCVPTSRNRIDLYLQK